MTETEGGSVDPRLLAMDMPALRAMADRLYGEGRGPLDVAVPDGSGPERTASGRPVAEAMTRGPLLLGEGSDPGPSTAAPGGQPPPVMNVDSIDPRLLRALGILMGQTPPPPSSQPTLPPGYVPPQDESRDPVVAFRRLLALAPRALEAALPSSRERSLVKTQLDQARLWFEEAVRMLEAGEEAMETARQELLGR